MEPAEIATEAARWRLGLRLGAYVPGEVVAWADSVIRALPEPPLEMIALAYLAGASRKDVHTALSPLAEGIDEFDALPRVLFDCRLVLVAHPEFGPRLARALYEIWLAVDCEPPEQFVGMGWFDDAYSLARSGIGRDEQSVYAELLEFTEVHGSKAPARDLPVR